MNGERKPATAVQQQHQAALEKQAIAKFANAMPLPGELINGFPASSKVVEGIVIRPAKASDVAIMQKLGSSLYRKMIETQKAKAVGKEIEITLDELDFQDMIDLVWMFSVPSQTAYAAFQLGKESFQQRSCDEIGSRLSPDQIASLFAAVCESAEVIFATAISYGVEGDAKEKVRDVFFRVSPMSSPTDSAGG